MLHLVNSDPIEFVCLQSLSPQADGITQIVFSPDSAHLMGRIQLIAVHLVCADVKAKTSAKTGMLAGLSATLEVRRQPSSYIGMWLTHSQHSLVSSLEG